MTKQLQVSVIVPVRNGAEYIGRCIRSLLNQSMEQEKYEIIVINDASTDKTKLAIKTFLGDVVYFENKKRKGLPATLNTGIKNARGQFVVRVDADDWVHPEYIKILYLSLTLNLSLDAVACDYIEVNNRQKEIATINSEKKPIGCGIMFKLKDLIKIGLYDKKFLVREEEDLIIRFKKYFKLTRIPIPLYRYRKHENNITNKKKLMNKYFNKIKKKYKK